MKLREIIDFNPSTPLAKGQDAPFVDMATLSTDGRFISGFQNRPFSGSGSKFRDGDTLFARITPCLENGKGGFVRGLGMHVAGHGSTEFIVFRARQISDSDFIYYVSRHPQFRIFAEQQMSGTSGRQRVSWQSLADYEIPECEPEERAAIGATLGVLDEKIELNRQMNETLEATARAIFTDWFVYFGPTRAKHEGRAPYLAPDIWSLFPDRFDDAGKPLGSKVGTLGELIEIGPSEPMRKGEVTPYLDMAALPTYGSTADFPIPREYSSGTRFRNGDTLLARITPCLENGKTAFVQNLPADAVGWGSTEFIVMRSISPVPKAVSYLLAREPAFRRHAIQSMTGTSGRQRASSDAISAYPVAIPPDDHVWVAFEAILTPLFAKIAANAQEAHTLAATRDLLLPKLMSGEVKITDAEREAE